MRLLSVLALAAFLAVTSASEARTERNGFAPVGTFSCVVDPTTLSYDIVPGVSPSAIAVGWFNGTSYNVTGWGQLSITTSGSNDQAAMYCAGYLEAYLTLDWIWMSWPPFLNENFNNQAPPAAVADWFRGSLQWTRQQIITNSWHSDYWRNLGYVMQQFSGLSDAYARFQTDPSKALTELDLFILVGDGDLETVLDMFNGTDSSTMTPAQLRADYAANSHCSSLVKLSADRSELFTGHTTWSGFQDMLRIWKFYDFPLVDSTVLSHKVAFSSYPAFLSSVDDFYMTDRQLMVTETTNSVFSRELLDMVSPTAGVLSWMRAITANRMASTGPQWLSIFSQSNSGTYNNQWIIVDYKLFTAGQELPPNTVWIGEQIPGLIETLDVTSFVNDAFWPSYNIPYSQKIFNASGYPAVVAKLGPDQTYEHCPRANIFRRDAPAVNDIASYRAILRYNKWQTDPLSENDPGNAISSRFDLELSASTKQAFGGIDTKATTSVLIAKMAAWAENGPTHDNQVPFSWSQFPQTAHNGQAETFDFEFVLNEWPATAQKKTAEAAPILIQQL